MLYNAYSGIASHKFKMAVAVMDAESNEDRFTAAKQLLDIAGKILEDARYTPTASEFTAASKGAVCILPEDPSMYEGYPLDILFSQNSTRQALPASATKVLTLVTGLSCFDDLYEKITVKAGDVQTGSGNYLIAGDIVTVQDLIYGMMLPSSNTSAYTFAREAGKRMLNDDSASDQACITRFIREMNLKADMIGCTNSTFTTVTGLAYNNYSTASDLLRILISASSYPVINRIWNKKEYSISIEGPNERSQSITTTVSDTALETDYYIFGGKTGSLDSGTSAASLILIAENK